MCLLCCFLHIWPLSHTIQRRLQVGFKRERIDKEGCMVLWIVFLGVG